VGPGWAVGDLRTARSGGVHNGGVGSGLPGHGGTGEEGSGDDGELHLDGFDFFRVAKKGCF